MQHTSLVMSSVDVDRIRNAMAAAGPAQEDAVELLEEEICRAKIVAPLSIPRDVVTMNSRVQIEERDSGRLRELTLVYPHDANIDAGRISVLAPIGSALLGLRVGQTIEWPLPGKRTKKVRVVQICYQPEAAGDYEL